MSWRRALIAAALGWTLALSPAADAGTQSGTRLTAADWHLTATAEVEYPDRDGHRTSFGTDVPNLGLKPYADLLAAGYHRDEIESVYVFVTTREQVGARCGDELIVACYTFECEERDLACNKPGHPGLILVAHDDPDIAHTLLHEYGHHVDFQLYNLQDHSPRCRRHSDGSRRWLFAREAGGALLDRTGCGADTPWQDQLAEVFAEDYAQLSGINSRAYDDRMPVGPPSFDELLALRQDIDHPYEPTTIRLTGRSSRTGVAIEHIRADLPVFASVDRDRLRGVRKIDLRGCDSRFRGLFVRRCGIRITTNRPHQAYSVVLNLT